MLGVTVQGFAVPGNDRGSIFVENALVEPVDVFRRDGFQGGQRKIHRRIAGPSHDGVPALGFGLGGVQLGLTGQLAKILNDLGHLGPAGARMGVKAAVFPALNYAGGLTNGNSMAGLLIAAAQIQECGAAGRRQDMEPQDAVIPGEGQA